MKPSSAGSTFSIWSRLATCFGVGYLPKAPGTWGTLVAIPFAVLLAKIQPLHAMLTILVLTIVAVIACERFEKEQGEHDSSHVVIDEFVGYLVAVNWLPFTWQSFFFAFAVFRFLDISKPLFIGKIDRTLKGGIGVMADDLAAGIVTNILLQTVFYQTQWLGQQWSGGML